MNRITQFVRWTLGAALLASSVGIGVFGISAAARDGSVDNDYRSGSEYGDHDSDDDDSGDRLGYLELGFNRAAPTDAVYQEECGSCHVAYPPGLLPSASWRTLMAGLDDHFSDNAELPDDTRAHVETFLDANASDRLDRLKSVRLLRGVEEDAPLRITGLPYFKREHREIPRRMVEDNPDVRSFSRCDACHGDASRGHFDEDTAAIPGFGRWDD